MFFIQFKKFHSIPDMLTLYPKLMLDYIKQVSASTERIFVKIHVNFFTGSVNKVSYISLFQMLNQSQISGLSLYSNLVMNCCLIYYSFSLLIFCLGYFYLCSLSKISLQFSFLVLSSSAFEDFLISFINWAGKCSFFFYSKSLCNILIIYFFKSRETYL